MKLLKPLEAWRIVTHNPLCTASDMNNAFWTYKPQIGRVVCEAYMEGYDNYPQLSEQRVSLSDIQVPLKWSCCADYLLAYLKGYADRIEKNDFDDFDEDAYMDGGPYAEFED